MAELRKIYDGVHCNVVIDSVNRVSLFMEVKQPDSKDVNRFLQVEIDLPQAMVDAIGAAWRDHLFPWQKGDCNGK